MAAPDILVIADALAACYASGTLTPPTGYPAVRRSTARIPNAITMFPFVTVMLPDGTVGQGTTGVQFEHNFQVRFWYAKHTADQARDMTALLAWLGPLLGATTGTHTELGLNDAGEQNVKSAVNERSYRFFVDTYAGSEFYGWELDIPVMVRDWTF
jgi:hypothetical protein